MGDTTYRFYEDSDAEAVVDLFVRNRFYLGKTGEKISPEEYRYYQKKRGMLFAVLAEKDGVLIGHVGAYPTGCQRVMGKHQVLMDTLLIDKDYQKHLFSIVTMFRMLLMRLGEDEQYTTLISEVAYTNRQSMLMQRQFGAVKLNQEADCYGQNEMYNFVLAIRKLFDEESVSNKLPIERYLTPVDKRKFDEAEEIIDGNYVDKSVKMDYGTVRFRFHILSGYCTYVDMGEYGLKYGMKGYDSFTISNSSEDLKTVTVEYIGNDKVLSTKTFEVENGKEMTMPIPVDCDLIRAASKGLGDIHRFFPKMVRESCEVQLSYSLISDDIKMENESGFLRFFKNGKNVITEMWPCMRIPYVTGSITPNYSLNLSSTRIADNEIEVTEAAKGMCIKRHYLSNGDTTVIDTKVHLDDPSEIDSIIQFVLDDKSISCDFYGKDATITHKEYDYERDVKSTVAEMLYIDLLKEEYSKKELEKIVLTKDEYSYEITFSQNVRAYYQYNYIGVIYDTPECNNNGDFDFGTISIKEVSN